MNLLIFLFVLSLKTSEKKNPTYYVKGANSRKMNQLFNSGKQTSKNLAIFTKHLMQEFK